MEDLMLTKENIVRFIAEAIFGNKPNSENLALLAQVLTCEQLIGYGETPSGGLLASLGLASVDEAEYLNRLLLEFIRLYECEKLPFK